MAGTGTSAEPFIPVFDLRCTQEDLDAVAETLRSGWLTAGPRTQAFEQAFAADLGVEHAIAVASCTAALHLSYLAVGVGPGDEVIVPSYTMAATAAAVAYAGATPVFADVVSLRDPTLDPEHVAQLLGPRTRAVVTMHFGGYPSAVEALGQLCDDRGIALLEDAAHSPLATVDGRRLGTFGRASAFSFFSNKVLSSGEGGLVATDDAAVAAFARSRRSHAMSRSSWDRSQGAGAHYDVADLGFNYRIDDVRSALLGSRLRRLADDVARRRELTRRYRAALTPLPGITVPFADDQVDDSSCYVMPIMVDDPDRRDDLRIALRERHGVQTSLFYPAVHEFSVYRERYPSPSLPRTERAARSEITLPLFTHLTESDQDRVVAAVAQELEAG